MLENLKTAAAVAVLPILCVYRLVLSFCLTPERKKTWRRVVFDSIYRWMVFTQSIPQLAYLLGDTTEVYLAWSRRHRLPIRVEDIDGGAKLLWVGDKHLGHVVLYLHGGGFILPMADGAISFWRHVQKNAKETSNLEVGVVILDYTLVPHAEFPVPLLQSVSAVKHLLSAGVEPENVIITGDSAGGNLVLQLLQHMTHPIDGLPRLPSDTLFKGAFMMSPWLDLIPRRKTQSYKMNGQWDIITPKKLHDFGNRILTRVPDDLLPYLDTYFTDEGWYNGIEGTVENILVTAGGAECLRDDIIRFSKKLSAVHSRTKLIVDEFGVHNDPFFDFFAGQNGGAELTPYIIQWLVERFNH